MKAVLVFVDVWNVEPRAWLQTTDEIVPTDEIRRIKYFVDNGKLPGRDIDIYPILNCREKKKVDRIAEPINISGFRGTIVVKVDEKKLEEFRIKQND